MERLLTTFVLLTFLALAGITLALGMQMVRVAGEHAEMRVVSVTEVK